MSNGINRLQAAFFLLMSLSASIVLAERQDKGLDKGLDNKGLNKELAEGLTQSSKDTVAKTANKDSARTDQLFNLGLTLSKCSAYWNVMAKFDQENADVYTDLEKKFLVTSVASAKSANKADELMLQNYQDQIVFFENQFKSPTQSKADVASQVLAVGNQCTKQLPVINKLSQLLRNKLEAQSAEKE